MHKTYLCLLKSWILINFTGLSYSIIVIIKAKSSEESLFETWYGAKQQTNWDWTVQNVINTTLLININYFYIQGVPDYVDNLPDSDRTHYNIIIEQILFPAIFMKIWIIRDALGNPRSPDVNLLGFMTLVPRKLNKLNVILTALSNST